MKQDRQHLLLHDNNMIRSFVILALPLFGVNLLTSLNDLIDTYFVGNMPNSVAAQSGMSVSWPFLNILIAFNMGIAVAGVAVISQYLGAGKKQEARKYGAMLVMIGLVLGVVINALVYFLAPFVLHWMGAEGGVYDSALTYVRVRSFELVFLFFFAAFQSIRQARGDTLTPVIYSTIGIFVNVTLNWLFIYVWGWGVFGAAFATVISIAVRTPFCFYHLFIEESEAKLTFADLRPDFTYIKEQVRVAIPGVAGVCPVLRRARVGGIQSGQQSDQSAVDADYGTGQCIGYLCWPEHRQGQPRTRPARLPCLSQPLPLHRHCGRYHPVPVPRSSVGSAVQRCGNGAYRHGICDFCCVCPTADGYFPELYLPVQRRRKDQILLLYGHYAPVGIASADDLVLPALHQLRSFRYLVGCPAQSGRG